MTAELARVALAEGLDSATAFEDAGALEDGCFLQRLYPAGLGAGAAAACAGRDGRREERTGIKGWLDALVPQQPL